MLPPKPDAHRQTPVGGPLGLSSESVVVVVGNYNLRTVLRGTRTSACTSGFATHVETKSPPGSSPTIGARALGGKGEGCEVARLRGCDLRPPGDPVAPGRVRSTRPRQGRHRRWPAGGPGGGWLGVFPLGDLGDDRGPCVDRCGGHAVDEVETLGAPVAGQRVAGRRLDSPLLTLTPMF